MKVIAEAKMTAKVKSGSSADRKSEGWTVLAKDVGDVILMSRTSGSENFRERAKKSN